MTTINWPRVPAWKKWLCWIFGHYWVCYDSGEYPDDCDLDHRCFWTKCGRCGKS